MMRSLNSLPFEPRFGTWFLFLSDSLSLSCDLTCFYFNIAFIIDALTCLCRHKHYMTLCEALKVQNVFALKMK